MEKNIGLLWSSLSSFPLQLIKIFEIKRSYFYSVLCNHENVEIQSYLLPRSYAKVPKWLSQNFEVLSALGGYVSQYKNFNFALYNGVNSKNAVLIAVQVNLEEIALMFQHTCLHLSKESQAKIEVFQKRVLKWVLADYKSP